MHAPTTGPHCYLLQCQLFTGRYIYYPPGIVPLHKIIKNVLFFCFNTLLMPCIAIFTTAADIGYRIDAAVFINR
jgi:hypothetical protein